MVSTAPEPTPPIALTSTSAERLERVLAVSRAFLTVTALLAIYIDPAEPARLREVTYGVLLAYASYSLLIWVAVRRAARLTRAHTWTLHGLDVLWTSGLTFVSQGPISPFFLFFLFVVLAAAYRWGFRATLGTALVTIVVYLAETAVAAAGPWKSTSFATLDFDLNTTILRVAYLLLTGVLLGYLAEQDKTARAELASIAAAARQPHLRLGLGGTVIALGQTLRHTFGATAVAIAVKDEYSGRALLWRMDTAPSGGQPRTRRLELDADAEQQWLFAGPGSTWYVERPDRDAKGATALVDEPPGWRLTRAPATLPAVLLANPRWQSITAANLGFESEWRARVYLFGAAERRVERRVHFLRALADHATPALTNVFLLRRLRARAGAAERARVARELHDGAIQSLFAIDMKLEALRRDPPDAAAMRGELEAVQGLVRQEVTALRELMQALRPVELDASEQLPDVLATLVERFRRESGIGARFVATGHGVPLPPAKARELFRITQEALVNVRKHSGAGQVLVRLATGDSTCQLVVEDDGRGFPFEGRLTGPELDARQWGPVVIKERARLIGADVAVESSPGGGARVEIVVAGEVTYA
jgi:signal transduction histidine kinase